MTSYRSVYMDHAATTAVDPRVLEAMLPCFTETYGNASSAHRTGQAARRLVEKARETVADLIGASPGEIIFTAGGTESDNLALRGGAMGQAERGRHIITSAVEHHAVGHTCDQMERLFGYRVTYLPVDSQGLVDPSALELAITPETTLVSVMHANNEVGTVEPIAELSDVASERKITFHTDAVQAAGYLDLNVDRLGVDMMSLSGHKFQAPKGIGILYVRQGTQLLPVQTGGGQERRLRSGTENVPYIVGIARALELAYADGGEADRVRALRDRLVTGVLSAIPDSHLVGHPTKRLPNNASLVFEGIDGEAILLQLDLKGVAVSTGSACSSADTKASHVLTAMGLEPRLAQGSIRFSLGRENTECDVDYVLSILPEIVGRLRELSPVYQEKLGTHVR